MSEAAAPKSRWKKLKIAAAVVCALLLVAYFSYASIIAAIIGQKLHRAIETRLNAQLEYDSLTYTFPLEVKIVNARLVREGMSENDALLTVQRLNLRLAKIPYPHTPLVIQSLDVQGPMLHIVRTGQGVVSVTNLQRSDEEVRRNPPEHKLSDIFELRKFVITDGQIKYEDRTIAGAEPLVFRGITVDLGITPQSTATYAYQFNTRQPPYVDLASEGTFDLDDAILDFSKLTITAQAKRADGESAMPPQVQKIMNDFGIGGVINISSNGRVPFKDFKNSAIAGDVHVKDVRFDVPNREADLDDLDVRIHAEFRDGKAQVDLQQFSARSAAALMTAHRATANVSSGQWKIDNLSGTIEAISRGPTTQPARIGHTKVLAGSAEYTFDGSGDFKSPPKYSLALHPVGVSLLPKGFADPIQNIAGNMQITGNRVRFWNASGDLLAGHATAAGTFKFDKPTTYDVTIGAQSIDLAQVAAMPAWNDRGLRLTGSADLTAKLSGTLSHDTQQMLTDLKAQVESDITGMNLWKSPVLTAIANTVGAQGTTMSQGNGAFVCSIADRTVTFQRGAIHTKLLGLQGKGTIGFDAVANMDIIAAPLGNWRASINKHENPADRRCRGQFRRGPAEDGEQIEPIALRISGDGKTAQ